MFVDMGAFGAHLRPPLCQATQAGTSRPSPSTPPIAHNNRPLLGLLGPGKDRQHVTNENDLLRALPPRVLTLLSLFASWQPPELRPGLKTVANTSEGRSSPFLNSLTQRGDLLLTLTSWPPSGSSPCICSWW